jgi:hypothetical protein
MAKQISYTAADALKDLGGIPSDTEIDQLLEYYDTYKLPHRKALLEGMLSGRSQEKLLIDKLHAKGLDISSKQSKGGHGRWVPRKLEKTVRRFKYLRFINQGFTRIEANRKIYSELHPSAEDMSNLSKWKERQQNNIRNDTRPTSQHLRNSQ